MVLQDGYSTRLSMDVDHQVREDGEGCLGFAGFFLALASAVRVHRRVGLIGSLRGPGRG